MPLDTGQRALLAVHAHPDDESSSTGGTLARYSAQGVRTIVVTCTGGEVGEIAGHVEADPARLAQVRAAELAEAIRILGVSRSVRLGYRDSGMAGTPDNDHLLSFHRADLTEAIRQLVQIVREERPQVIVTYDEQGGYGHPDHVNAHRVATGAFHAAGDRDYLPQLGEPWAPSKLYYTAFTHSQMRQIARGMREAGVNAPFGLTWDETAGDLIGELPFGTPDELVTTLLDNSRHIGAKLGALLAHRSQMDLNNPFLRVSTASAVRAWSAEAFRLAIGPFGARPGELEDDLFAGL